VHRYAVSIRHFRAHREFTPQKDQVPEDATKRFDTLVTFYPPEHSFQLTRAFVDAVDAAEVDAGNQQRATPNGRLRANVAPAPRRGAGQPGPP
jgi:uncharacterized protein (DUF1684 family)